MTGASTPPSLSGQTTPSRSVPSTPYGTFPRSARPSSGYFTPPRLRAVSNNPLPQPLSTPTRSNLYTALKRRISGVPLHADTTDTQRESNVVDNQLEGSSRGGMRYRDPSERARKEGNPQSWAVIGAYLKHGSEGTTPGIGTASGFNFGGAYIRNEDGGEVLTEEPVSYATVDRRAPGEENEVEDEDEEAVDEEGYRNDGPKADDEASASVSMVEEAGAKGVDGGTIHVRQRSDSDSDSDDESPAKRRRRPPTASRTALVKRASRYLHPPITPLWKNVTKCVVAYALAELFTFVPFLSELVGAPFDLDGPVRNAHVIATVAVYFNPAKTIGAMLEADLFMILGLCYAVFLCCGSMAMTVMLNTYGGHYIIAHTLVLVFWLGAGFGFLAYVKVKVNKPTATTAGSLVSLIASVIITKEGAFHVGRFQSQAILQVVVIVFIGTVISNIVCFSLWAGSATSKLQVDLNKTLNSFSTLLEMLTKTFLLDEDVTLRPESLKKAIDGHQASFTSLRSSLSQAKYEVFLDSRLRATVHSYDDAVKSMTRLAQGLTGLRSGCSLQYDLMRARSEGKLGLEKREKRQESEEMRQLLDEMVVLEQFRERVGASMSALTWTSKRTLALLRTSFVHTRAGSATLEAIRTDDAESALSSDALLTLKQELVQSLLVFKRSHSQAIKILYQRLPAQTLPRVEAGEDGFKALAKNTEEEDDGPNDNLFRIYYFCFNLEQWVEELSSLVDTFVDIRSAEEDVAKRHIDLQKRWGVFSFVPRTWNWFTGLRKRHENGHKPSLRQRVHSVQAILSEMFHNPHLVTHSPFPERLDGALSSHQVHPSQLTLFGRVKRSFWHLLWQIRQPHVKFAVKTGVGVTILASAAFIPRLRPIWLKWRGEWALISYNVIMSPTIGSTNFLAIGRVLGTVVGALAAVIFYTLFPDNPIMLPILGAIFSIPCFWVIVDRPLYGPSSRFVLLTFNLTCLYAYNLREADTHVLSIALHRSAAVGAGVVWGLFISLYVWPMEARRELRKGLSDFFLDAAYLYETIVRTYSVPPAALARVHHLSHQSSLAELRDMTPLLPPEAKEDLEDAVESIVEMEVYLQISLIRLSGLLASTKHEPRLKGPFPVSTYKVVLASCQAILDLLSAMRVVTTRDAWYTSVRRDFVIPCNPERREMVGNVLLYFSILASVVALKTPLPPFLPPAAEARFRLIRKLRSLPVVRRRTVRGGSEGLLYLAYAISMKDVIQQLDLLGATFQTLFGIIGGETSTGAFESLFVTREPLTIRGAGDESESDSDTETSRRFIGGP